MRAQQQANTLIPSILITLQRFWTPYPVVGPPTKVSGPPPSLLWDVTDDLWCIICLGYWSSYLLCSCVYASVVVEDVTVDSRVIPAEKWLTLDYQTPPVAVVLSQCHRSRLRLIKIILMLLHHTLTSALHQKNKETYPLRIPDKTTHKNVFKFC